MTNVEFDEQKYTSTRSNRKKGKPSFFYRMAMKVPGVNNTASANVVLLVVAVAAFAASVYTLWSTYGGGGTTAGTITIEDIPEEERDNLPPEVREQLEAAQQ